MAKENKKETSLSVKDVLARINDLNEVRKNVLSLNNELDTHKKDLTTYEKLYGVESKEYALKKEMIDTTINNIKEAEDKVTELSFKKSELKGALDEVVKEFDDALKAETAKEYHIELASEEGNGKNVFKKLMKYLEHNVKFTPQTAANLMVLHRNMEENKEWVKSKDFDNVIILRSASVISLYRFVLENLEGRGYFEAREFLECWANCGQNISEAVREIQKNNTESRELSSKLDLIETEFNNSEDDLPKDEQKMTTQEEVAPEVGE